jgi:hypothetical protein
MRRRKCLAAVIFMSAAVLAAETADHPLTGTFTDWLDHPAVNYTLAEARDPVAQLDRRLREGEVQLTAEPISGYLRPILNALGVTVDSQIATFAKRSLQRTAISRTNPRVIFFNDNVWVGWVRGGFIELASQDPGLGTIFYVLEETGGRPRFTRKHDCLDCHYSYATAGVAGLLARSTARFPVDQTVPLAERWGGFFVTGVRGPGRHLGNGPANEDDASRDAPAATLPSFAREFDASGYPSTQSDVVALMVFDHQTRVTNLLNRIGWEARVAAHQARTGERTTPSKEHPTDQPPISMEDAAREVVDYLLFLNEAPLPNPIKGASGFAERFAAQGLRDRKGRSLRQVELRTRLLRYPCSYMIYAPVFEGLPAAAKDAIYRRLWEVLSGEAGTARLSLADRRAIVEILRDTKPDLPSYFGAVTG